MGTKPAAVATWRRSRPGTKRQKLFYLKIHEQFKRTSWKCLQSSPWLVTPICGITSTRTVAEPIRLWRRLRRCPAAASPSSSPRWRRFVPSRPLASSPACPTSWPMPRARRPCLFVSIQFSRFEAHLFLESCICRPKILNQDSIELILHVFVSFVWICSADGFYGSR